MSWAGDYAFGFDIPRPAVLGGEVLYLDFDGVLHPEEVWVRPGGRPYLDVALAGSHELFEHAPLLAELLQPYPEVRIVLSTTWARRFGYERARRLLPPNLAARCVGCTSHSSMPGRWFDAMPRGQQVREDVHRRRPDTWLAIDDNVYGWADAEPSHVVLTHFEHGIAEPSVLRTLRTALMRFSRGSEE